MKIISVNYKICEKTMSPILYGIVYIGRSFYDFDLKVSAEFIHDLRNNTNLVNLEELIKKDNLLGLTSDNDLTDIYYLIKSGVHSVDDESKEIINLYFLQKERNNKLNNLGI